MHASKRVLELCTFHRTNIHAVTTREGASLAAACLTQ